MKKILALLLVLCMLFSLLPAALAADGEAIDYVALGDCKALGYALEDTTKCYVDLLTSTWGVTSLNLAIDDADSATLLAYLSGTDYDSRLATAKRITVDVGMFDILNPTIKYVCEILGIDSAENDGEAVLEKLNALQINEVLEDAQALETKMKTDEVVAELTAATEAFATNFAAIIARLKEINPTADIVVYDIYNPMAGFKITNALLSYIISTSSINLESIGEKYTVMMNDAINAHHDEVGGYIIVSLYGFNATASDGMTNVKVPDINELFNSLGTTDFNNIDWENLNVNGGGTGGGTGDGTDTIISFEIAYDPHPSEAGHQAIHDRTVERRPTIEVPAPVTLTFNTNGGTPVSSLSVPLGDTVDLTKYTSTKEGYVFAGWGQTSTTSKVITSYKMTANKTVYAIWTQPTVNLVFETNGGDAISSVAVLQGTTVDLSAYVPTREGFIFTHWYSDADLTNIVTSVKVDADTTVYAGWREEGTAAPTYTLTFNVNGGTAVESAVVEDGTVVDLSQYTTTKDNCSFKGWYSDAALKTPVTSVTLYGNMTVYAGWEDMRDTFTVAFETNGGSEIASFTAAKGTIVNLSEYTTEREGFNFVSWYSDEAMTKAVVLITVNADVTLYAKWEEIDNFANFVKKNTYTLNYFVDIDEDGKWYGAGTDPLTGNPREGVIKACFEYGLMDGVTEDPMFDPEGNLTIAQTITLAARIHNIYNGGDGKFEQGSVWYEVYVDYAIENNIIGKYEFSDDYTRAATRAEMAYIFVNALGADGYKAIRNVESIPDVAKDAKYAEEIYLLYNAGVLSGNDELGTFTPDANIQRSAAAAIIARAAKIVERQSFAIPDIAE